MKNLIVILSALVLSSCIQNHEQLDYYVVGKEYRQGGMCCDSKRQKAMYMAVTPVTRPIVVSRHIHQPQKSEFIVHIARPNYVTDFNTDSLTWLKYKCGQKIKH